MTRDKVKQGFIRAAIVAIVSLAETGVFLGIVWLMERAGVFSFMVVSVDGYWVYPYESGGLFFALILTSNVVGGIIWSLISDWMASRKDVPCCDDITCIGGSLPMCYEV